MVGMFGKLLVANRGEIACRVIRTARRLGIRCVAVYSDADSDAAHVAMADEAYRLGPAVAQESYLNIQSIIAAARASNSEAIHPGYGFLSENPEFAEACASSGVVFVGPPAPAIRAMGLKDRAKALMQAAGVPVVPGYAGEDQSAERIAREAAQIGYPLLIKAVAGGGGKGMRRVDRARDLGAAIDGARREALSAFDNGRILVEKCIARARHIEVQIFADGTGNAVHLFERDCSLQRRHQKVIEEATAPDMPEMMRERMGAAALQVAKAVGYIGAGTVEFIVDVSRGLRPECFWFMEMNTRLQVEHTVTEAVTELDLVEWQLRVAAGERLPKRQGELRPRGHAIEARLYAEDPQTGFLPSVGRLERLRLPEARDGIRVDTGVREGDEVTVFYDPMIAKVIAWDEARDAAAGKLAQALCAVQVAGVRTNAALLIRTLRHPEFLAGKIDTDFIRRNEATLILPREPPRESLFARAALFLLEERRARERRNDPWDVQDGFRLSGEAHEIVELTADGTRVTVDVAHHRDASVTVNVAGVEMPRIADSHACAMRLASGQIAVIEEGETWTIGVHDPFAAVDEAGAGTDRMIAPMPGKIVQILVRPKERVKRGQALVVLEAMKMEHTLAAPADAFIASIEVATGDQITEGDVILRFGDERETAA